MSAPFAMAAALPVPPWSNQDIVLFHATTLDAAENILTRGVQLNRSLLTNDFGSGFYTTTNLRQATAFAAKKAARLGEPGGIVEFAVQREELAKLEILAFVLGTFEAVDFWSLVRHCRMPTVGHGRGHNGAAYYDAIFAPVARNWRTLTLHSGYDQISFHTDSATALLNTPGRRRIILP